MNNVFAQPTHWGDDKISDSLRFTEGINWAMQTRLSNIDSSILIVSELMLKAKEKNDLRWYLRSMDVEIRLRNLKKQTDPILEFLNLFESASETKQEEIKAFFAFRIGQIYGSRDAYAEAIHYHLISLC